ncbi:Uncharacterized mitochondrial protein AtMg00750, partial [Striga hermonthica]
RKGCENVVAYNLSRLTLLSSSCDFPNLDDSFPYEHAFIFDRVPWYADIANYLASGVLNDYLSFQERKRFISKCRYFLWEDPYLFHLGKDEVIRRCVSKKEQPDILTTCHLSNCGGHFGGRETTFKVLKSGFYCPTIFRDSHTFSTSCDRCQRSRNIGRRNEMPLNT